MPTGMSQYKCKSCNRAVTKSTAPDDCSGDYPWWNCCNCATVKSGWAGWKRRACPQCRQRDANDGNAAATLAVQNDPPPAYDPAWVFELAPPPKYQEAATAVHISRPPQRECSICLTAPRTVRLSPCGHACRLCKLCFTAVIQSRRRCPIWSAAAPVMDAHFGGPPRIPVRNSERLRGQEGLGAWPVGYILHFMDY